MANDQKNESSTKVPGSTAYTFWAIVLTPLTGSTWESICQIYASSYPLHRLKKLRTFFTRSINHARFLFLSTAMACSAPDVATMICSSYTPHTDITIARDDVLGLT